MNNANDNYLISIELKFFYKKVIPTYLQGIKLFIPTPSPKLKSTNYEQWSPLFLVIRDKAS